MVNSQSYNTKECLQNDTIPCPSLEYISSHLTIKKNISIIITSDIVYMSSMAVFSNIHNISIEGQYHNTTILCNGATNSSVLMFNNCTDINIRRIRFVNCTGRMNISGSTHLSSIMVHSSKTLSISDVTINGSYGYGLITVNLEEHVTIHNSNFTNNGYSYRGGTTRCGGVMILNSQLNATNTSYEIYKARFFRNNSTSIIGTTYDEGLGGGLRIANINSSNINISITHSEFTENVANWGGGLQLWNKGHSTNNNLTIEHCTFQYNTATMGGGGCDIVFWKDQNGISPVNNRVKFTKCLWNNNRGSKLGGGMSLFTSFTELRQQKECVVRNIVIINKCNFTNNAAQSGVAVATLPIYKKDTPGRVSGMKTHFESCIFVKNTATNIGHKTSNSYPRGGTIEALDAWVKFLGNNTFDSNHGSGIMILSATAVFENSSNIFHNNKASKGGALYLLKHSFIETKGTNTFIFEKNTAKHGGAIMVFDSSAIQCRYIDQCFVKGKDRNLTTYEFKNNQAVSNRGNDMFIYTLLPCVEQVNEKNILQIFHSNIIGTFKFSKQSITTNPYKLEPKTDKCYGNESCIYPVPGRETALYINQLDQLNQTIINENFMLSLELNKNGTNIELESDGIVFSNGSIVLKGKPMSSAILIVTSQLDTTEPISINIIMSECYPGFVYVNDTNSCRCSDISKDSQFEGIPRCIDDNYALLQVGYWAGYTTNNNTTTSVFVTGDCLPFLCSFNNTSHKHMQFLKMSSSRKQLDKDICAQNRQGMLCSQCSNGSSVYYNSPIYSCQADNNCNAGFGWLLLSEIIPTTLLFLFILFFNVNLTSGPVYTLIFYIQILDVFSIDGFGHLQFNRPVQFLVKFYKILYGIANLKFFRIEGLSFCIWNGAKTLDVMILKYAVTAYAVLLILGTIALLKVYSLYMCMKLCKKCGRRNIRYSVVNSLSAFVLICYFHMINTSIAIVYCVEMKTSGKRVVKKVLQFDGNITCFSKQHLVYILIATVSFTIISILPFLLVTEPLILKLNAKLKLKMHFYSLNKLRIVFKPFLDSFQGCFKNDCRIFAGLFFAYRIVLIGMLVVSSPKSDQYFIPILTLIIIILIHSIIKPFATNWHNKLDIFLLLNLLTIIFLSYVNIGYDMGNVSKNSIACVQLIIGSAPLLILIGWIGKKIKTRCNHRFGKRSNYDAQFDLSGQDTIFAKIDSNRTSPCNYQAMH